MKQYIVDAFSDKVFAGNPAAAIILDEWIDVAIMQKIAQENNIPATVFAVKQKEPAPDGGSLYHIRWFLPGCEINLCGHGTVGMSYVIFNFIEPPPVNWPKESKRTITYTSLSGFLTVSYCNDLIEMDFPRFQMEKVQVTPAMIQALGAEPVEAYLGRDLLCIMKDESVVRGLAADQEKLKEIDGVLVHVSALADPTRTPEFDCVSRSFGPKCCIPEDPLCGSGHCHITDFWSQKLGKKRLVAYGASKRGGTVICDLSEPNRVKLLAKGALFAIGEICCL